MGHLFSSGPKPIGSLQDYQALQGQGPSGPMSDLGGLSGLGSGALGLASLSNLGLGPLALGASALSSSIPELLNLFSGRSATGPGSATSNIAGATGNSDPVLSLLGRGAGALGNNTPISSPSAGSTFGPYFDVAKRLEDLYRWGPGGLTDPKADKLSAETLKNALTDLGNPGKTSGNTVSLLEQAFNKGQGNLNKDTLKLLEKGMDDQEIGILQHAVPQFFRDQGSPNPQSPNPNPQFPNPNPQNTLTLPQQFNPQSLASLSALAPAILAAGAENINPMMPIELNKQPDKNKKFQLPKRHQDLLDLLSQMSMEQ